MIESTNNDFLLKIGESEYYMNSRFDTIDIYYEKIIYYYENKNNNGDSIENILIPKIQKLKQEISNRMEYSVLIFEQYGRSQEEYNNYILGLNYKNPQEKVEKYEKIKNEKIKDNLASP